MRLFIVLFCTILILGYSIWNSKNHYQYLNSKIVANKNVVVIAKVTKIANEKKFWIQDIEHNIWEVENQEPQQISYLFAPGEEIIMHGIIKHSGFFIAHKILVKHDSQYRVH